MEGQIVRIAISAAVLSMAFEGGAGAQAPVKIGLIQSLTGSFNTVGKAVVDGARLYVHQHGDVVAGRRIQLIVKDDATAPDQAKRIAQEMIVKDKVAIIGAGITPSALTIAPLVTEAKVATVVMVSGASITVERSPYMVRTSFTLGQSSAVMADWAVKNGARKIVTMVNDWAPGSNPKPCSGIAWPRAAPTSSNRCACHLPIRILRRFCNAHGILVRTRCLCFQPIRLLFSPSSSWSAAWTSRAFDWLALAISPMTTNCPG